MLVYCAERCGASWSVPDEAVVDAMSRGEIVVRTTPQQGYSTMETVGICPSCQNKHKNAERARMRHRKTDVEQEHRELMHLIAQTRSAHPDWELQRCVTECVEYLNGPEFETNPAFRAYLLERAEHDS